MKIESFRSLYDRQKCILTPDLLHRVEFHDVLRLNDGQVKHSPEFFYAGSLWKVCESFNSLLHFITHVFLRGKMQMIEFALATNKELINLGKVSVSFAIATNKELINLVFCIL